MVHTCMLGNLALNLCLQQAEWVVFLSITVNINSHLYTTATGVSRYQREKLNPSLFIYFTSILAEHI